MTVESVIVNFIRQIKRPFGWMEQVPYLWTLYFGDISLDKNFNITKHCLELLAALSSRGSQDLFSCPLQKILFTSLTDDMMLRLATAQRRRWLSERAACVTFHKPTQNAQVAVLPLVRLLLLWLGKAFEFHGFVISLLFKWFVSSFLWLPSRPKFALARSADSPVRISKLAKKIVRTGWFGRKS